MPKAEDAWERSLNCIRCNLEQINLNGPPFNGATLALLYSRAIVACSSCPQFGCNKRAGHCNMDGRLKATHWVPLNWIVLFNKIAICPTRPLHHFSVSGSKRFHSSKLLVANIAFNYLNYRMELWTPLTYWTLCSVPAFQIDVCRSKLLFCFCIPSLQPA